MEREFPKRFLKHYRVYIKPGLVNVFKPFYLKGLGMDSLS